MRRGKVFLYLSLVLVLLVAGGYLIWSTFFQDSPADSTAEAVLPDTVEIVFVTQRAPRGTILNETVLGLFKLPRDLLIAGMFTDLAQVVGRQAKFDLDSGIPLTFNMLVDSAAQLSTDGSVASLSIPEGMVAKTISIGKLASVSYALRPGDRVVVIASMKFIDLDSEFQTALPNGTALVLGSNISLTTDGGPSRLTADIQDPSGLVGRTEVDDDLTDERIYMIPSESQRPRLATQIIIPSATVLHVGNFTF
jgi:Flp pilus assembly protein CpaB